MDFINEFFGSEINELKNHAKVSICVFEFQTNFLFYMGET